MHRQKVKIGRQSKKLQIQGAQILRNETYLRYAAVTKDAAERRSWTFYEVVNCNSYNKRKGNDTLISFEAKYYIGLSPLAAPVPQTPRHITLVFLLFQVVPLVVELFALSDTDLYLHLTLL